MDVERRESQIRCSRSNPNFARSMRAMAGNDYRDSEAKSFKFSWERAENIRKSPDFCIRHTFAGKHDDVHATRHQIQPFTNSRARRVARSTALISVTRSPPSSSSRRPSTVQPAGVVTISFSFAGCSPVCRTMFAAPCTICAAITLPRRAATRPYASLDQRLDDRVNECWAAGTKGSHRIHVLLIHNQASTYGVEHLSGGLQLRVCRMRSRSPRGHSFLDKARRVRHRADYRNRLRQGCSP